MGYIGLYSRPGAVQAYVNADEKVAQKFTTPTGGFTVSYMAFECGIGSGAKVRLGIYSDNAGEPNTLLREGTAELIGPTGFKRWHVVNLSSPLSLSGSTSYWLAIISDTSIYTWNASTGGGTRRYNADTYSDGFASTFGSASSGSGSIRIFAAEAGTWPGDIIKGGSIFETSGGIKTAIAETEGLISPIELGTLPELYEDEQSATEIFGGGSIGFIRAAIDSNDIIHVIASGATEQTSAW